MIRVTVKLFAALREAAGRGEIEWEVPDGATAAQLITALHSALPALEPGLGRARIAVNRAYARPDTPLVEGDEVALFPPVSGG